MDRIGSDWQESVDLLNCLLQTRHWTEQLERQQCGDDFDDYGIRNRPVADVRAIFSIAAVRRIPLSIAVVQTENSSIVRWVLSGS